MASALTPEPPSSNSKLTSGAFKSSSSHSSYEFSRKVTETTTLSPVAGSRTSYGSDHDNYRSLSPVQPVRETSSYRSITQTNMNELDNLLDDLNSVKISRPEVQQLSNGSSRDLREESPLVDTKSAGQVSELVANLESDLRHSSGSLQKWKQGKEIKPITTETFVEEKNTTIECKPQPIISSPLKAVQTSPRPVKRDPDLENLVNSIPEAPKSSLRYRVEPIAKGTCCVCKKPIHGQLVTALGKCWHLECFTCLHCGIELGKENFFEKDGKPYCENDFHMLFSPKCGYCSEPIIDKCVSALGKTWHPEHFFCCICGATFGDEGYHEMDGKAYCRIDYFDLFAPKCAGCENPITENYISALDAQWHPDCFVCYECRCPFVGGSFFDFDGKPYCETHYHAKRGSLCAACHKPIMGRCITAMFRKFHPQHFVCSFCLKQLTKGTFKEHNDKPYCHGCFDKLFS